MKEIFINKDNLKKEEIDEEVIRVKGIIINSNNELLLGYSHNMYQFPGGHLEKGEKLIECLRREIKEETGIDAELYNIKPFMLIEYYTKNYFNSGKNRCNKIYYFEVKTDNKIRLEETNYTEDEIDGNYELRYIEIGNVKNELIKNASKYPKCKLITSEMMEVLSYYLEGQNE